MALKLILFIYLGRRREVKVRRVRMRRIDEILKWGALLLVNNTHTADDGHVKWENWGK